MTYRADIDGIRAIAVGAVLLFHFGVPGFDGGFVGVDVFFVLSGYLISRIIFDQLDRGRFSFTHFYFRRLRRLFPVYAVVMLVTGLVAYQIMLPADLAQFGQSAVASTVYLSNILFYMEAGYFDTASHLKPLLHTWSLSVEEQFYLVFPFVAWCVRSLSRQQLFWIFGVLTLVSFAACVWILPRDASAAFFLYPFRAWEMFLGTLLATGCVPPLKTVRGSWLLSVGGLILIAIAIFGYNSATPFPGFSALLPCLGTVMLLHAGLNQNSGVQKVLASPVPVWGGKLSYSLYLWHWPVAVLYQYRFPDSHGAMGIVMMASATLAASVLSYWLIETPCREGRAPLTKTHWQVFSSSALASFVFIAVGFVLYKGGGLPSRLPAEVTPFAEAAGDLFGDFSGCVNEDNSSLPGVEHCRLGEPMTGEPYLLVWADSHGGAYMSVLRALSKSRGVPVLLAWSGGCPPLVGLKKDESVANARVDAQCGERNKAMMNLIENDPSIASVLLVGRWSYYLRGEGIGVDVHNRIRVWPEAAEYAPDTQAEGVLRAVQTTIDSLLAQNRDVYILEQAPEFPHYDARALAIALMAEPETLNRVIRERAQIDYSEVLRRQDGIVGLLDSLDGMSQVTVLRTHRALCRNGLCSAMLAGTPAYFDNNHLSARGARQLEHIFAPFFTRTVTP